MKKIFASSQHSYFHYDSRKFNVGDIVKGNQHDIDADITLAYEEATKLNDTPSILYHNEISVYLLYEYKDKI